MGIVPAPKGMHSSHMTGLSIWHVRSSDVIRFIYTTGIHLHSMYTFASAYIQLQLMRIANCIHILCRSTQSSENMLRQFLHGTSSALHSMHIMGLYCVMPFSGCLLMKLHPMCQQTMLKSGCLVCRAPIFRDAEHRPQY